MPVGETHALCGEAIEVGRGDLRLGMVAAEIAVAKVVGIENEDVRLAALALRGRCQAGQDEDKNEKGEEGWRVFHRNSERAEAVEAGGQGIRSPRITPDAIPLQDRILLPVPGDQGIPDRAPSAKIPLAGPS